MLMCNLTENSNNYSKTSIRLWQCYKDELTLPNAGTLDTFPGNSHMFRVSNKDTNP